MFEQLSPERTYRRSFTAFFIAAIVLFLLLTARLWYLQVIQGDQLSQRSEANRVRTYRITSPRGMIKDRWGRIVVDNRPSYDLIFNPRSLANTEIDSFLANVCRDMGVDLAVVQARLKAGKAGGPIKIKDDVTREDVARIETLKMMYQNREFPLNIEAVGKRTYKYPALLAHVIGYTGEIDQQRLESPEYAGYQPGDRVGRAGLEAFYEAQLRGEFGAHTVEENARSVQLRDLQFAPAQPGKYLQLSIDLDLQQAASKALGNLPGAIVALDPRNGQVLAMVSQPAYNPDVFNQPMTPTEWDAISNNAQHPLQNKAIGGQYPPGSTFKVVSALGGLQEGEITPDMTLECLGKWKYLDRYFRCHNEKGHGWVNLNNSLIRSCDIYYYKVGVKLGIDRMARYARMLGVGRESGIDLPGELTGLMPTPEWKRERYHTDWLPGETLNTAIGQGSVTVTPLQLANIYAVIANGGTLYRPQIVQRVLNADGTVVRDFKPAVMAKLPIDAANFARVRRALMLVINDPGGTGYRSRLANFIYAGKTGTSQVRHMGKKRVSSAALPYEFRDHAAFVCFAPWDNPTIVIAVLCEHAGHGGTFAAPIAREVLLAYLEAMRQHPEYRDAGGAPARRP